MKTRNKQQNESVLRAKVPLTKELLCAFILREFLSGVSPLQVPRTDDWAPGGRNAVSEEYSTPVQQLHAKGRERVDPGVQLVVRREVEERESSRDRPASRQFHKCIFVKIISETSFSIWFISSTFRVAEELSSMEPNFQQNSVNVAMESFKL